MLPELGILMIIHVAQSVRWMLPVLGVPLGNLLSEDGSDLVIFVIGCDDPGLQGMLPALGILQGHTMNECGA